jgi:sugar O-acyltransferase (sialic acid O-acetyltransferase NeuD family)
MRDLVIFGTGQIAEVAHYYFTQNAGRNVSAFTVDAEFITQDKVLDVPVMPFEEVLKAFPPETHEIFVAMSFKKVNKLRMQKVAEIEALGYTLAHFVHTDATVWSGFEAQPNTFIMENNTIQPFVTIGKNVIVWSGNHIGHHTQICDHCFIASHVVISGSVNVGEGSFLGVNSTVRDNVNLGSHVVLGAGSLLLSDAPDNGVYIGGATEMSRVPSNRLRSI